MFVQNKKIKLKNSIMKGRILPGKVLVKKVDITTKGGILLPESLQAKETIAEIVMVGDMPEKMNITISPKDRIIYSRFVNTDNATLVLEGESYLLLNVNDIQYIFDVEN